MDNVIQKLHRLRGWFVFWFVAQAIIGTAAAAQVLDRMQRTSLFADALRGAGPAAVVSSGFITAALLALALWVFHEVIRLKNWARLALLVVGWLSALSALSSLMGLTTMPMAVHWFSRELPGMDLGGLAMTSAVTNGLSLVLWGYVILTLQFEQQVRDAFRGPAAAV